VVCFAQTTKPNQIEDALGPSVSQTGNGTMQIIRECRMRAAILTAIAKEAPELENQLLYVAEEWLTLAILREQLNTQLSVLSA
jgi:DnaJ-domain-containing protein 1